MDDKEITIDADAIRKSVAAQTQKQELAPGQYRPILAILMPALTKEQYYVVGERISRLNYRLHGWDVIVLDGFKQMDIKAFGVPESNLAEFDELKAMLHEAIKTQR